MEDNKVRGTLYLNGFVHIYSETLLNSNQWYHIAITYDRFLYEANFKIFINGQLENNITHSGEILWDENPLTIGSYPWYYDHQNFHGNIHDVQIWDYALMQQEIQQNMYQILDPQNEEGLVAYWPMDEGQGNIIYDHTNYNNHGMIYGAQWGNCSSLNAVISAESDWIDDDFNGYSTQQVSANLSTGDITNYVWTVGTDTVATGIEPFVELRSGSWYLTLTVSNDSGDVSTDSLLVSVYAAKFNTGGPIYSAVTQLDQNNFFISSADDRVYQFDSTGNINWSFLTGGDIQSTVTVSDEDNIFVTSSDTRLYSFNSEGIPNWDEAMGGVIVSSPTINQNNIFVGLTTGRLFSVNFNGDINWSIQTNDEIVASAVISINGNVYFGSKDNKLYAVSSSGGILWTYTTADQIISSPALGIDESIVFGSTDGNIYKLDQNGNLLWEFNTGGAIYASPIIGEDGQIFIGSSNGIFYSINAGGDLVWQYDVNSPIKSAASISSDASTLYVGSEDGRIMAFSVDGSLNWYLRTESDIVSPTLITENNLIFASNTEGSVFILKDDLTLPQSDNLEWPTFLGNNKRTGDQKTTITNIKNDKNIITVFNLKQNYPNPFNPTTTINFDLPIKSEVRIRITNVLGEIVEEFNLGIQETGTNNITWNAANYSSGIYLYSIQAVPVDGSKEYRAVQKMVLLK